MDDCLKILKQKGFYSSEVFPDIYTDAVMVLRNNIISGKIEELSSVKNYLISTCINMSRQEFNRKMKTKSREEEVKSLLYPDGEMLSIVNDDSEEMIVFCKQALNSLTDKCQRILVFYYVHNLSMKDIAQEMELSSSDVAKTLKSRCYKKWIAKTKELMG